MKFWKTKLKGAFLIQPDVFKDKRGFFLESFSKRWLKKIKLDIEFVQDNHSLSRKPGVLRGLHFQLPPHNQAKLVRVTKGEVYDVILDLRIGSETYGKWEGFRLSEKNFLMLLIPHGFAHAFITLKPGTEFMYKVDEYYFPKLEGGILWNDPDLKIKWPLKKPILSEKDKKLMNFRDFKSPFKI